MEHYFGGLLTSLKRCRFEGESPWWGVALVESHFDGVSLCCYSTQLIGFLHLGASLPRYQMLYFLANAPSAPQFVSGAFLNPELKEPNSYPEVHESSSLPPRYFQKSLALGILISHPITSSQSPPQLPSSSSPQSQTGTTVTR